MRVIVFVRSRFKCFSRAPCVALMLCVCVQKGKGAEDEGNRSQEPCLKATNDVTVPSPEAMQVYANHSTYGFRSCTEDDW